MKTRSFQWGRWLTLAVLLAVALAARAQLSRNARLGPFRFIEYYPPDPLLKAQTNAVRNLLRGTNGTLVGPDVFRIRQMRLENYPQTGKGTNLIAQSPEAYFDKEKNLLNSTNRIDLVASDGQIHVKGETGFLFSMDDSALIVSNRVRAVIYGAGLKGKKP